MTGFSIEILVDEASAGRAIDGLMLAISDANLSVFMEQEVNPYLTDRIEKRFSDEGDDVSGPWAELTDATQAIREAKGYDGAHPINVRTGELEQYLIHAAGDITVTGAGVSLVTPAESPNVDLALKLAVAQGGGTSTWGSSIPARPVIGINDNDEATLTVMLLENIETQILLAIR